LIANNAGVEGEVIVEALQGLSFEMGYNAMDDRKGLNSFPPLPPDIHLRYSPQISRPTATGQVLPNRSEPTLLY